MIREAGYDIFDLPLPESLIEHVKQYERIDYVHGTGLKARAGIDRGAAYDGWVKAYVPVTICGRVVQNTAKSLFCGCNCLYDIDPCQVRKETLVRAKEDMEAKIKNLNSSLRFSKKLLKAAELGLDSKKGGSSEWNTLRTMRWKSSSLNESESLNAISVYAALLPTVNKRPCELSKIFSGN